MLSYPGPRSIAARVRCSACRGLPAAVGQHVPTGWAIMRCFAGRPAAPGVYPLRGADRLYAARAHARPGRRSAGRGRARAGAAGGGVGPVLARPGRRLRCSSISWSIRPRRSSATRVAGALATVLAPSHARGLRGLSVRKATGKLLIVAVCGIGGAPSCGPHQLRTEYPLQPLTENLIRHLPCAELDPHSFPGLFSDGRRRHGSEGSPL
jgi:hypothetical protein